MSSTLGELATERRAVSRAIAALSRGSVRRAGRLHRPVMLDADSEGNYAGAASLSTINASQTKPAKFVVFLVKDKGAPILVPTK